MIKLTFRGLFRILHTKFFNSLEEAGTYIIKIGYKNRQYKIEELK